MEDTPPASSPAVGDEDPGEGPSGYQPPRRTTPPTMSAFDVQNEADAADAVTKAASIKIEYNHKEVEFWFNQIEAAMKFRGIKHQWTKLQVLITLLPAKVCSEVKHLLRVREETAADNSFPQSVSKAVC